MKTNIHPVWFNDAKVTCACGNTFSTGSTLEQIKLDICSNCHPFFTGQQKYVDTLGQVDKFQKKSLDAVVKMAKVVQIRAARDAKTRVEKLEKPSLKDLLMQARKNLKTS